MDCDRVLRDAQALAVEVIPAGPQLLRAPSPRHALAWLQLQYWSAAVFDVQPRENGGTILHMQRRPFFRGHARSEWKPVPQLLRRQGAERELRSRVARLAADIIELEFESLYGADGAQSWPPFERGASMCAAQHYHVETDLLDWTANPSVAVHFATCSASSAGSSEAAVLVTDPIQCRELGLHTLVPPVYVARLFLQRGLFTRLTDESAALLERRVTKMVFPAQPACHALDIDGGPFGHAALLPEDDWFRSVADWSLEHVDDPECTKDRLAAWMLFNSRHGRHPAVQRLKSGVALFDAGEHAKIIIGFIDELALRRHPDRSACYDTAVLDLLEAHNPRLFEWFDASKYPLPRCYPSSMTPKHS